MSAPIATRDDGGPLVVHASVARFTVHFEGGVETARRALRAAWGPATERALVPSRSVLACRVAADADGVAIHTPRGSTRVAREVDAAPALEGYLYDALLEAHAAAGLAVLHASAVVGRRDGDDGGEGRALVFAGPSGAGKSALARAAIEAGMAYLGDEHIVTDGEGLWGVPRAIHLDPHVGGSPRQPWHAGADFDSYRVHDPSGASVCRPLVAVSADRVPAAPVPLRAAVFVALRRGERDALAPLSARARLAQLEACAWVGSPALSRLATLPLAFELTWSDPGRALSLLCAQLS